MCSSSAGIVLHQGKIAEMATGEGKDPGGDHAALPERPFAQGRPPGHRQRLSRSAETRSGWARFSSWLGLSVACLDDTQPGTVERQNAAYAADITYGTNNEFGFDYLRDNMVIDLAQRVQRPHSYAIIDEVDSVLIDEARTPLIISGPAGRDERDVYRKYNGQVSSMVRRQHQMVNSLIAEGSALLKEARGRGRRGEALGGGAQVARRAARRRRRRSGCSSS